MAGPSLRAVAREAIEFRLREGREPETDLSRYPPHLHEPRATFVTLRLHGELRGCTGSLKATRPLVADVVRNACRSAFDDPRFAPLEPDELANTTIEISVLTPLRVVSPDDVTVGRDGILVERGRARGLLLPQVAVEYGWDRKTFLDHTCRKAGLEPGCWRHPDTIISVFSAEVFGEDDV